jgi:hypothetical protein
LCVITGHLITGIYNLIQFNGIFTKNNNKLILNVNMKVNITYFSVNIHDVYNCYNVYQYLYYDDFYNYMIYTSFILFFVYTIKMNKIIYTSNQMTGYNTQKLFYFKDL